MTGPRKTSLSIPFPILISSAAAFNLSTSRSPTSPTATTTLKLVPCDSLIFLVKLATQTNHATGNLTLVELVSTEGHWPRDFAIDPSGKFLVASNEESGNLTLYSRNESTGKLTLLQKDVQVPFPLLIVKYTQAANRVQCVSVLFIGPVQK